MNGRRHFFSVLAKFTSHLPIKYLYRVIDGAAVDIIHVCLWDMLYLSVVFFLFNSRISISLSSLILLHTFNPLFYILYFWLLWLIHKMSRKHFATLLGTLHRRRHRGRRLAPPLSPFFFSFFFWKLDLTIMEHSMASGRGQPPTLSCSKHNIS